MDGVGLGRMQEWVFRLRDFGPEGCRFCISIIAWFNGSAFSPNIKARACQLAVVSLQCLGRL